MPAERHCTTNRSNLTKASSRGATVRGFGAFSAIQRLSGSIAL